ncbi:MAG: phage tail protein [Eubacteriaceae bacterium]|nr:phage tail protein [Eubacteriaceae bacterium]
MAFTNFYLTDKGATLQARVQAGATLTFTKAACGKGDVPAGTLPTAMTALANKVKDLAISNIVRSGKTATIRMQFTNKDTTAFNWKEIGLYATDPVEGEILYCYGNCGANADAIPAGSSTLMEFTMNMVVQISTSTDMTLTIDDSLIYATNRDISAALPASGWVDKTGYFTQDVTAAAIVGTDKPILDFVHPDGAINKTLEKDWSKIYKIVSSEGKLTIYASAKPTSDFTIQVKVVR